MSATGDVVSYLEMCQQEGASLQQGMNFRPHGRTSVFLMSRRAGAPYRDSVNDEGRVLTYEDHDVPRVRGGPDPKIVDQELSTPNGTTTQNGRFFERAQLHQAGAPAELVRVYEKVRTGIWVFNGAFRLTDAWAEQIDGRRVFKFRLELTDETQDASPGSSQPPLSRVIPTAVKLEVWRRDHGRCVECGATDHLHFDHIIPWSRGGSSITADNVQLLCARHNLAKHDHIR